MEEAIKNIIETIYIKNQENTAIDVNAAQKMAIDLKEKLEKNTIFNIKTVVSQDKNFSKLKYGESCTVAFDIIFSKETLKEEMVIQVSKLGNYARLYWRKKIFMGGVRYIYDLPKSWDKKWINDAGNIIREHNIKILNSVELADEFSGIQNCFDKRSNATVDDLLFCFDGPH